MIRILCLIVCLGMYAPAFSASEVESIKGATTVNALEAMDLYQQGALFVDVRDNFEYQLGHIRSAVHLDLKREFNDLYLIETLDRNIPIVIYCNSSHCYRSAVATFLAVGWGYENVYYFKDGYFTWLALDFPATLSGDNPEAQPAQPDTYWRDVMQTALNDLKVSQLSVPGENPEKN